MPRREPQGVLPGPVRPKRCQVPGRLDKLTLVCMGMWSLIREKTGLTEEDLVERVTKIDLADGQADGKVTRRIAKCPKCDRMMAARHKRCMYCGHEKLDVTAFDATI